MTFDLVSKKALIFDFDGVILDSEKYKLASYPLLFTEYPEKQAELKDYLSDAAGVNRFIKFQKMCQIVGLEYTEELGEKLSKKYDELTLNNLKNLPLVNGVEDFLKNSKRKHFIASSTPIEQLKEMVSSKNIEQYFTQIFGFPVSKNEAIKRVEELGFEASEIIFFGDAMADFNAANDSKVEFIGVGNLVTFPKDTKKINDFTDLI